MLAIEFGSKGRGDSDIYSDKDILLVGQGWEEINSCKNFYASKGCSVTCINFEKAKFLSKNGSLFFRHIFDEGRIISGDQADLKKLKNNWTPQKTYESEIEDNLDQLEVLLYLPPNKYGVLVGIDILINSIRNILIRKLAAYGFFVFAWETIFYKSAEIGLIRDCHIDTLRYARKIKNSYRGGNYTSNAKEALKNLTTIARHCLDSNIKVQFSNRVTLGLPEKYVDGSYKQLRAIELLCAHYEFNNEMKNYINAVKNPNYFCKAGPNTALKSDERNSGASRISLCFPCPRDVAA